VLIVAFHFVSFGGPALDRAFFDNASRHPFRPTPVPAASALVLIDESTLKVLSETKGMRWPFPRSVFASLIAALDRAGAAHIVMDFNFFEHSEDPAQDLILAGVAAATPRTVLGSSREHYPVFWDQPFRQAHSRFFRTRRTGNTDYDPDEDGVMRRYRIQGSLAAAAFDQPPAAAGGLLRWHGNLDQLRAKGVPVLPAASFIEPGLSLLARLEEKVPDWSPEGVGAALAAEPAFTGEAATVVRGRTVFVSANASGTYDLKQLPVGKLEPGLLLHRTAWTNLVDDNFIAEIPRSAALLASGVVAALVLLLAGRWPGLTVPAVGAFGFVVLLLPGAYAGISYGCFFAPATPAAAAIVTLLGVAAESFWAERARKREIQALFGAYVDQEVVEQFVKDPDLIQLGGEWREATVFFSDLVGFTSLSEKLPAKQMLTVVNAYLEETSECLLNHGAYVDKYIGDAVMAVFGVPKALPNHALAACLAALEAQRLVEGVNARYGAAAGVQLAVRIGLNSGELLVGNVGSSRKKSYTVMGDTVNLASRLEGANKAFHTDILIGPETARRIQGELVTRPLARLRVKGKLEAVEVHTVLGRPGDLTPALRDFVAAYRAGYDAYVDRRFEEAVAAFARAEKFQSGDLTTGRLREESQRYSLAPPPADWEPVLILESK